MVGPKDPDRVEKIDKSERPDTGDRQVILDDRNDGFRIQNQQGEWPEAPDPDEE
jgi:hypothetical protein